MRAVLAASMLFVLPLAASADQADYTAAEVAEHFVRSVDLGPARGICIGTAQECGVAAQLAAAANVDLMVNFELDSYELSASARANLLEFAKALEDPRLSDFKFSIEGHTDATGPASYNLQLSQRRAEAVVRFLSEHGADPSRFVVQGFGESSPRTDDPFDPVNRRVETRIVE